MHNFKITSLINIKSEHTCSNRYVNNSINSFVLFSCYIDEEALPLDPDEINPFEDFEGDGKKIGKKKMLKLQAKEEKRQQRLVHLT